MDQWFLDNLVCPRDKQRFHFTGRSLRCRSGHDYPVIEGVPVMLLDDVDQTLWVARASIERTNGRDTAESNFTDQYFVETLGISEDERKALREEIDRPTGIDPVVRHIIAQTSGMLYKPLIGKLDSYPIPELRLPEGRGETFLDIGCNWGRWCVAAGRKGYSPVGIDPSIGAVLAARRVCAALGVTARFVVADARYLPFASDSIALVFSYSVLQHFSKNDVRATLKEIVRVLEKGGGSLIQMPNAYGVRSLYHQLGRGFREAENFQVRYWRPSELRDTFRALIGDTSLFVDGYFGLGIQPEDIKLLPFRFKLIVRTSEILRRLSLKLTWMSYFADSLYVKVEKNPAETK